MGGTHHTPPTNPINPSSNHPPTQTPTTQHTLSPPPPPDSRLAALHEGEERLAQSLLGLEGGRPAARAGVHSHHSSSSRGKGNGGESMEQEEEEEQAEEEEAAGSSTSTGGNPAPTNARAEAKHPRRTGGLLSHSPSPQGQPPQQPQGQGQGGPTVAPSSSSLALFPPVPRRLLKVVGEAIRDWDMIQDVRIYVCVCMYRAFVRRSALLACVRVRVSVRACVCVCVSVVHSCAAPLCFHLSVWLFFRSRIKYIIPPRTLTFLPAHTSKQTRPQNQGDRLCLGLSGGKDSLTLLHILLHLQACSCLCLLWWCINIEHVSLCCLLVLVLFWWCTYIER